MILTDEPIWLTEAREHVGLREIRGALTEPTISKWLKSLRAWWTDDETPWCGLACAAWMQACGIELPKHWYRAKAWADWGVSLEGPAVGCIVVFERQGGGHVGLVVGKDTKKRLLVLGGNQGDSVRISAFDTARVIAYRWPDTSIAVPGVGVPIYAASGATSTNEA